MKTIIQFIIIKTYMVLKLFKTENLNITKTKSSRTRLFASAPWVVHTVVNH